MDPLSDLLRLLKVRSYGAAGLDAGGDWAIQIPAHDGMKVFAVVRGACCVSLRDDAAPITVRAGECFLTTGRPFRMGNGAAVEPANVQLLLPPIFDGRIVTHNGGGDFLAVGGFFALASDQADLLLGAVPPIISFHKGRERDTMEWCVNRLTSELRDPDAGTHFVAEQLATLMLVQALRSSMAQTSPSQVGWLTALADPKLRTAIAIMHHDPQNRWTVQSLAALAGMSRTSFALRFRAAMGIAPLDYLTRWRMLLAQDRLATGQEPTVEIALAVGYDCERSFARAFRRANGYSPRQYRLLAQGASVTAASICK
jgi:AraC-like DNA-binding protein